MVCRKTSLLILLISAVLILTSCSVSDSLKGYDSIQDITHYPEKYEGKIVKVKGTPSSAFSLAPGSSYNFLFDKYENKLRVTDSCGDFVNYLGTKNQYVASGVYESGELRCFVSIYKEGNEPPELKNKISDYESNVLGIEESPTSTDKTESKPSCKEWIELLIPDRITLRDSSSGYDFTPERPKWKDGIQISVDAPYIIFEKGTQQGQNVNYYYLFADSGSHFMNPGSDKAHFQYNKQIIDNAGNILGNNNFNIEPVLKIIPDSEQHHGVGLGQYDSADFEIIEFKVIDCNLIKIENIPENNVISNDDSDNQEIVISEKEADNLGPYPDCETKCTMDCRMKDEAMDNFKIENRQCVCKCRSSDCDEDDCKSYCSSIGQDYVNSYSGGTGDYICYCSGNHGIDISPKCS